LRGPVSSGGVQEELSIMKVILFGATGMVGQGALRECLLNPDVILASSVSASPRRA